MLSIKNPSFFGGGMPVAEPFLLSDQHLRDINPVDCGWERCEPSHSFGPTARMYWLLHYVVSGSGIFESGGVRHPVRAGQMFVIHPLETTFYQADEHDPWEYIWIGFTTALTLPAPLREQAVVQHSGLGSLFSSVLRLRTMAQGRELFLCGQVYQLLSLLSERQPSENDYVEQAQTYLASNYMQDVSISGLAARLGLNRSYFSTLFHQRTGLSPQQYLLRCRMEHARELLCSHAFTPGEAALAVGYPDIFAFSRMFKRYYGVSPSEALRQNQANKQAHD